MTNHLYIVGAGASSEFGLPLGEGLKSEICKLIKFNLHRGSLRSGDDEVYQAIKYGCQDGLLTPSDVDGYLDACKTIVNAMPLAPSIDNFVETHKDDPYINKVAKLAITASILNAERKSILWIDPYRQKTIDFSREDGVFSIPKSWLAAFFKQLIEGASIEKIKTRLSCTKFIVFNYDRCIEHFLYHALQTYVRVTPDVASEILSLLSIVHPYGSLGHLPWQSSKEPSISFGGDTDWNGLLDLSQMIRTFTEGVARNSQSAVDITDALGECNISSFLGFAFAPINMRLLRELSPSKPYDKVQRKNYSTAFAISQSNSDHIKQEICELLSTPSGNIQLLDGRCSQLFSEYSRQLWRE